MKRYKTAARMIAAAMIAMSSMGIAVSQGIAETDDGGHTQSGETIIIRPADVCDGQPSNWEVHWDDAGSYCACTGFNCSGGDDGGGYDPPGGDDDPPRPGGGGGGGFCDENPDALSCQDEPEKENTCEGKEPVYDVCGDESCTDCQSENRDCEGEAIRRVTTCYDLNTQRAEAYCRVIGTPTTECVRQEIEGRAGTVTGSAHRTTWGMHGEGSSTFTLGPWQFGGSAGGDWSSADTMSNGTNRPFVPPSTSYSDCKGLGRDLVLSCVADVNACYEVAESEGEVCETD